MLCCALATVWACHASAQERPFSRDTAAGIIGNIDKIVTPDGVSDDVALPIGGARQWLEVRGRDRRNPILLVIHGGPGSPELPLSWAYQEPWLDYFTVVQWDQRGSGKSYGLDDPAVIGPTLSLDRIVDDAAEIAEYLRKHYGKRKIFVLGHSWGSVVGLTLAKRRPDLLYAYVGMGQIVSGRENEAIGYRLTLNAARSAGNEEAVRDLEALAPYPRPDGTVTLDMIDRERRWSNHYGGLTYGRSDFRYAADAWTLSPDYSEKNLDAIGKGSQLSLRYLLTPMLGFDYSHVTAFGTPIVIFAGRHDTTTPSGIVADWFRRVKAPTTRFVWFENSAHMIAVEEPGRVLVHLVDDVRPLAGSDLPR